MKLIYVLIILVLFSGLANAACDQEIDSYGIGNNSDYLQLDGNGEKAGQAITNSGTHTLCNASFYLKYATSQTFNFSAKLYACTGTVGTSGTGTGSALANSTVHQGSELSSADWTLIHFDFSSDTYNMVDATDYVIVAEIQDYTSGTLQVSRDTTTPSHAGNGAYDIGSGWASGAFDTIFYIYEEPDAAGTPNATSLTHTKSETWVNHTWAAGSGNVTDSYNVSVNSTWHNTTTVTHHNNTGLSALTWSNITVWAYNSTYDELSSGSVSENVQTDEAWAASNTATYWNATSPITMTTNVGRINLFSRTPTELDELCLFWLEVTT